MPPPQRIIFTEHNFDEDIFLIKEKKPYRWFVAITLCLSNIGNSMLWIGFAPITDIVASHYQTNSLGILMLANVFFIIMTIFGIPFVWLIDQLEVHHNIVIAVILNLMASSLRLFSNIPPVALLKYKIVLFAQIVASFSQFFSLFLSSRLAQEWFLPEERALANTVTSLSTIIGPAIISVLAPIIITNKHSVPGILSLKNKHYVINDVSILNAFIALPIYFAFLCICSFCCIEFESSTKEKNFTKINQQWFKDKWISYKKYFFEMIHSLTEKSFFLLTVTFATNLIIFLSTGVFISILLCPSGYSNDLAGWCNCLLFSVGFISSTILSFIVGKIGRIVEIIKVCFLLSVAAFIGFYISVFTYVNEFWLLLTISLGSLCAMPIISLSLILVVEWGRPLSNTQSTGMLWIVGQFLGFIWVIVLEVAARPLKLKLYKSTCEAGVIPKDYTWHWVIMFTVSSLIAIFILISLSSPYLRKKAEEKREDGM